MQIQPRLAQTPAFKSAAPAARPQAAPAASSVLFGRTLSAEEQTLRISDMLERLSLALTSSAERQQQFIDTAIEELRTLRQNENPEQQRTLLEGLLNRGKSFLAQPQTGNITRRAAAQNMRDGEMNLEIILNGEPLFLLLADNRIIGIENSNPDSSTPKHGLVGWIRFQNGLLMHGSRYSSQIMMSSDESLLRQADALRDTLQQKIQPLL